MSNFVVHPEWHSEKNAPQETEGRFHATLQHLSDHTKEGGVVKLKKEYPERYSQVWDELEKNFTAKGLARFQSSLERGIRKLDKWKD